MNGMDRIKEYFEEAIKNDEALRNVYDESKLKECWNYITQQAKKAATGNCACIEDAEVYKWARDFMYGDIAKEDKPNVKENNTEEEGQTVSEEGCYSGSDGQDAEDLETDGTSEEQELAETSVSDNQNGNTEEESKDAAVEIQSVSVKHTCSECGYFDEHKCLFHHYSVPNENSGACNEFVLKVTSDIKPQNEKLEITVEGETTVQDKPCHQKKENKKSEDYDGPWLFDFDDEGGM